MTGLPPGLLRCPACRRELSSQDAALTCASCGLRAPVIGGVPRFTGESAEMRGKNDADSLTLSVKLALKRFPWLFSWVHAWVAGPSFGPTPREFRRGLGSGKTVLNLGSGVSDVGPDVINVDYFAFPNVDVAADIHRLPLADASADAVLSQSVLEHLRDPRAAAAEMARVLKPGGLVYVQTPFLHAFHSSPDDFRRWTVQGLELLFPGFETVESGTIYGPTSSLVHAFCEWASLTLSLGSRRLHQALNMAFQLLLGPLRLFDLLLSRHADAVGAAHILYYVGRKPGR